VLSFLPGQRLSRCTCADESHPGPKHSDGTFVGRSAPEIDIFEAQVEYLSKFVWYIGYWSYNRSTKILWSLKCHSRLSGLWVSIENIFSRETDPYSCASAVQRWLSMEDGRCDYCQHSPHAFELLHGKCHAASYFVGNEHWSSVLWTNWRVFFYLRFWGLSSTSTRSRTPTLMRCLSVV